MENKYVYSVDGENYQYEEVGDVVDAIENSLEESETSLGKTYYRGIAKKPLASNFCPDADWIFEHMAEQAQDEHGEWAEEFPEHFTPDKKKELEKIIGDWCDANMEVTFYGVVDVEELVINEEDL